MQTEITTKVLMTNSELYALLEKHGFDLVEEYTLNDTYYSSLGGKDKVKEIDYQTLIRSSMVVRKVTESEGSGEECLIYKNKKFENQAIIFPKALDFPIKLVYNNVIENKTFWREIHNGRI